jgi:hypothetical protein
MPVLETKGAISAQGFGLTLQQGEVNYIEDVFSTWLYTGNGSTQTITNGVDLAGKGGLTWIKSRDNTYEHRLFDTDRGATFFLRSDATNAQAQFANSLTSFNNNGFSLGANASVNASNTTYASWSFKQQPKFFDMVTWTGNGSGARNISHELGSVPGCIIYKGVNQASNWFVYHQNIGTSQVATLQSDDPFSSTNATNAFNNTSPTSTQFTVGTSGNNSGWTYVAYLFAHNAGGFGLTGADNVISCGSFNWDGSTAPTVNLDYEPQWLLVKPSNRTGNWTIMDTMRGLTNDRSSRNLFPNLSNAEANSGITCFVSEKGFRLVGGLSSDPTTCIYIAIRRGPMKVPTTGTSVFAPVAVTSAGVTTVTTNFPVDLSAITWRAGAFNWWWSDRLRGNQYAVDLGTSLFLFSNSTDPQQTYTDVSPGLMMASNTTVVDSFILPGGYAGIYYNFRRAPSFFDEVCYTGNGSARSVQHNLAAVPELMFVKRRNATAAWQVYSSGIANTEYLVLNTTAGKATGTTRWDSTTPNVNTFRLGTDATVNSSAFGAIYVAYLFATCPGVSKVGSFTGTGATQVINCGFTGGARFVMIKATSTTGNWFVWDSARGIVSGNDPYLVFNTDAAEVTTTDWVDPAATGFELSNAGGNSVNTNGVTYTFLAIA